MSRADRLARKSCSTVGLPIFAQASASSVSRAASRCDGPASKAAAALSINSRFRL